MVEVMFIDKSGGCCDQSRVCRARWAGRRRVMLAGRRGRFRQTGARRRTFNYCLTLLIKQSPPSRPADRPPATLPATWRSRLQWGSMMGQVRPYFELSVELPHYCDLSYSNTRSVN
jgi:hypothetical protein